MPRDASITPGIVRAMTDEQAAFPEGFHWGSATAAHQIEGGNWNNDWWALEHTPGSGTREPSGDACDSWHRWAEDADLVRTYGLDNYRFSIEWSRIEPEEGEFSTAALDHYRRMCEGLLERGIDPVVTFHHFTSPRWLAARRRLGESGDRRRVRSRSANGRPSHLGADHAPGVHDQRAEHRRLHAVTGSASSRRASRMPG